MAEIQVAIGANNSGGLVTVLVQPDYDGIAFPREITTPEGTVYQDGKPFVELKFPDIVSADDWVAILAQFGLTTAKSALVTIRLLGEDKVASTVYNGRAVKQEYIQRVRWEMCWYVAPVIPVRRLEAI